MESISQKILIDSTEPLLVRFNKIGRFIRVYDGTRHSVLFGGEKYDFIYNRFKYLIGVKSGITNVISHNYVRIKVDSFDSFDSSDFLKCYSTLYNTIIYYQKNVRINYLKNNFLWKI